MKNLALLLILMTMTASGAQAQQVRPLRIGVAGLTHDHVNGILRGSKAGDFEIVGIAEANKDLANRYAQHFQFNIDHVYSTLEEMVAATKPEAVAAFGSIYEHLKVVQICAPLGIHVMVEKPLAVNPAHAKEMIALAKKYNIQLLTNYETTWYSTNHRAYELINGQHEVGDIRKVVIHDGHKGPKEIGVSPEFFNWLTDPVQNGGGAIIDFGCYGANLITWLMKGEKPISVTAVTQQIKPDIYPKVDDEATLVLAYPKSQGIIQASWNWPFGRKDMEIYGQHGYVFSDNRSDLRYRKNETDPEIKEKLSEREKPFNDPFAFFAAVIRGQIKLNPYDLSSMENNLIVVEILDAGRESAKTGKAVVLK
jgi:predicted dehydrogenase